jgi:thiol-disulfide isomerase/thioredoxin
MNARRRFLAIGGAWATSASLLRPRALFARSSDPPAFFGDRSQYTLLEPQLDVSRVMLRRLDGRSRAIGSYKGRALLVSLWASWCAPCRRELPMLARLQARSASEPFAIVPVSVDVDMTRAAKFLRELNLGRLEAFYDPDGVVASTPGSAEAAPFAIRGLPISYIVDPRGTLAGYLLGEADWSTDAGLDPLRFYGGT